LIAGALNAIDSGLVAQVTAIAYYSAAFLFLCCVRRARSRSAEATIDSHRERSLWTVMAIAMVLLGMNQHLDIASEIASISRTMAQHEGWYPARRAYQLFFVVTMGLSAISFLGHSAYRMRRAQRHTFLALFGLVFVATLTLVRAASFHQVDQLLYHSFWGIKLHWALEFGGIAMLAVTALCRLSRISVAHE
jgi:hypothetical protein